MQAPPTAADISTGMCPRPAYSGDRLTRAALAVTVVLSTQASSAAPAATRGVGRADCCTVVAARPAVRGARMWLTRRRRGASRVNLLSTKSTGIAAP